MNDKPPDSESIDQQTAEWILAQTLLYRNIEQMLAEYRELARKESLITEHYFVTERKESESNMACIAGRK